MGWEKCFVFLNYVAQNCVGMLKLQFSSVFIIEVHSKYLQMLGFKSSLQITV